jgi:hypothetical protein
MAKVSFGSLKLKKEDKVTTVNINDKEVEVLSYLPIGDKYDLIQATLQESAEGIGYNPILLEVNFYVNLIFLYTNLTFTDNQKEDKFKLYDLFEENNIFETVIKAIPQSEWDYLMRTFKETLQNSQEENRSCAGIVNSLISSLPDKAEALSTVLDKIDYNAIPDAVNFAKAIGATENN